ncbi:MAG: hypothetical protein OXC31_20160 [Spirochaetaceae bacterium]|nr:hypothetical protein [Spirochaetaceae bacterium]
MRTTRTEQPRAFQAPQIDQPVAYELEVASLLLNQHPELLDMVGRSVGGSATCGRVGLTWVYLLIREIGWSWVSLLPSSCYDVDRTSQAKWLREQGYRYPHP